MSCRSPAFGSVTSGSRCRTTTIWRCSRTACCAAATDDGRPTVIGMTTSGKSTVLRTGIAMKASVGGDALTGFAAAGSVVGASSIWAPGSGELAQADDEQAVLGAMTDLVVPARRQGHPAFEVALGQLQAMDPRRAQRVGQG